jgi:hypothetical protein
MAYALENKLKFLQSEEHFFSTTFVHLSIHRLKDADLSLPIITSSV